MKRIVNIILLGLILVISNASAKSNLYFKDSEITLNPGETKSVDILFDTDTIVNTINTELSTISDDIEYTIKFNPNLTVTSNNGKYTINSNNITKNIATLSIKAKDKVGDNYINLSNTNIGNTRLLDSKLYINIVPENKVNNKLYSIVSNIVDIDFDENIYRYEVDVTNDIDKLDIKVLTDNKDIKYRVSDQKLKVGTNNIDITIYNELGDRKVYRVIVNRLDKNYIDKEEKELLSNQLKWGILSIILAISIVILVIIYMKLRPYL